MELKYLTRGMSDPKGKPRVWFSCHPADFDTAFPMIPEDILRHANCAVWYDAALSEDVPEAELEEILKDMQLVVLAVTSIFLDEENRARNRDLPLALKNHIPVLPIMLENGLGYRFSNTCAKIQVVMKYVNDPTATPYEDVLETFLSSVLVGDELAEQVRNAFDAYVFLSYRKKDRRHAQRLMRLIHENQQFRDIAIWYDEYLVPGEGFNEAIRDAFAKSSLFAMAVTPHLEEERNYVMRVEYPMAVDREKTSSDFVVVPVEMYEPQDAVDGKDWRINPANLKDREEFKYREIPGMMDEHRRPELNRTLIDSLERIAKKESDGSSLHRFFIGLAYLNGIDVEIDQKRALDLIVSAAMDPDPCMDASARLADMYRNGEGVGQDPDEAVRWQNLLVSQYREAYEKNHDPDEHKGYGTAYFKALRKLSVLCEEAGSFSAAVENARRALDFCDELDQEVGVREMERDKVVILNHLGSLYRNSGDMAKAEECFGKAAGICERQVYEIGTRRARRDYSVCMERLGDLCRKRNDPDEADRYYEKVREIRENLNEAAPSVLSRRDLSSVLTKLGNVRKSQKDYAGAKTYYEEALAMDRILAEEVRTPQAWDDYAVSLVKAGDIHKAEGRYREAADHYGRAEKIFRENTEKTGSLAFSEHFAGSCEKLAGVLKRLDEPSAAKEKYQEAVRLRDQIYRKASTTVNAHSLAVACYNAAGFLSDGGLMRRAYDIWNELSLRYPEYEKYRDKAEKRL